MSGNAAWVKRIDFSGKPLTDGATLIDSRYYTGSDFYASAQGITTDGRYYYCTGTIVPLKFNGLTKIDMATGRVVLKKERYLPPELARQGFNHYGGCTFFEKKIYVAIEDKEREHPCIGVFDADTLEFTGQYRILGPEIQPNGNLPWCAADKDNRLVFQSLRSYQRPTHRYAGICAAYPHLPLRGAYAGRGDVERPDLYLLP